ncbi:MAG: DUF559 domain-containing protein [Deltaproteobacteria bacterium]|nr:DUF559 domain-containing protein [Deltaproteobacteria bacterium]
MEDLRAKHFGGFKFHRLHHIDPYFADLCGIKQHLIVELDGGRHAEQHGQDAEIDDLLEAIYEALTDS